MADASPPDIRPARPADVPVLLEMFRELAVYEKLEHVLVADERLLAEALFGARPAAEALLAERGGQALGYAVYFSTFSTFLARAGIWLEDVFVRPEHRGGGLGRALVAAVAAVADERGAERMEWSALTWNELALGFYRGLGAERMDEWVTLRLTGEGLRRLAAEGRR
jgi:GNAT superfamily N-acetyltransferase